MPRLQLRDAILKVWAPLGQKLETVRAERDKLKLAMLEKKERELEEEYVLQRLRRTAALQVWDGVLSIHYFPKQSVCLREKDWCCRARVTPARSLWRAHVTYVPRLRKRQSFSRTLLSQKSSSFSTS